MWEKAKTVFVTKGQGQSVFKLNSFDNALLDAQIANYNHSLQSSIIPPGAILTYRNIGLPEEGAILPTVLSRHYGKVGETIVAALAFGMNTNPELPGLIYELSGNNEQEIALQIVSMIQLASHERNWILKDISVITSCLTVQQPHGCVIVAAVLLP